MATIRQVQAEHVRRLNRLIDRGAVSRLKRLYDQAQAELERKISRMAGRASSDFTSAQYATVLAQLKQGQIEIMRQMSGAMRETAAETIADSLRGLIRDIKKLEKKYAGLAVSLPIEEAARFAGIVDRAKASLVRQSPASIARYGARVIQDLEQELALSMVTGESVGDAIDRVQKVTGGKWHEAERIIITETAYAHSASHAEAIADSAQEFPDMLMRWVELVDDRTGKPLDNRVAADSIAMHGQLAAPGGTFIMPPDPDVSSKMWGRRWTHPPNRPRDRAVVQAWRPHWGTPGWIWRGGRKVWLRR